MNPHHPHRFQNFVAGYFILLQRSSKYPPTPTALNRWMGRKPTNVLDGELTRWRTFLLRETGFEKKRGYTGRWVRRER